MRKRKQQNLDDDPKREAQTSFGDSVAAAAAAAD